MPWDMGGLLTVAVKPRLFVWSLAPGTHVGVFSWGRRWMSRCPSLCSSGVHWPYAYVVVVCSFVSFGRCAVVSSRRGLGLVDIFSFFSVFISAGFCGAKAGVPTFARPLPGTRYLDAC